LTAKALLEKFSTCDVPIIIEGETGTGKELAARAVHYASARKDRPFIPVNCGAIPETLLENEFFGHKRGAFTDAKEDQRGLVSMADGGTLFLDEVDALSPRGQVVLLRFLQDGVYRQIGAASSDIADVRIVAATNVNLNAVAQQGRFRTDLLFRLQILYLVLPPLRERREDVPLLADHFLAACSQRLGQPPKTLHCDVLEWMQHYPWPGNVRELENFICRAFVVAEGDSITLDTIRGWSSESAAPSSLPHEAVPAKSFTQAKIVAISQFEVRYLVDLMKRAHGNVTAAARLAGTERRYLGKLLKKHHLDKARPLSSRNEATHAANAGVPGALQVL
jgi:DNA-binding NtrC family response regulator